MIRNEGNVDKKTIRMIIGPTGVGKSAFALDLASKIGGEIVSADSMQVYKYMDIGTAKPGLEEQKMIPHHLIDIVYPDEEYNVYRFRKDALQAVKDILGRGKEAIVVGGSGLYIEALIRGIFEGPSRDEKLRKELKGEEEQKGKGYLWKKLNEIDPISARRIHPNDIKRLIRALEVYMKSGKKLTDFLTENMVTAYNYDIIYLHMDRNALYERINMRVDEMVKKGLIEEVRSLIIMGYNESFQSMKAIGYKEVVAYLKGIYDKREMLDVLKRNTRKLAKRQICWFKRYPVKKVVNINLKGKMHFVF